MQTNLVASRASNASKQLARGPHHAPGITPEQMAKAGVPLALARWYHCVSPQVAKPNVLDELRMSQVRVAVALMN